MPLPRFAVPLEPDADLRNADWIKTFSWDFPQDKFPMTEEELNEFLADAGISPEHFRTLPAYLGWRYRVGRAKRGSKK